MAENDYPQDEFDRLAARRAIRGTHRRKESMLKWWIALALIVILAPTAGWGIVQFWGSQGSSNSSTDGPTASQSNEASDAAASSGGETAGDDNPSATDSSAPSSDPSQSASSDPSQSASSDPSQSASGGVQTDRRVLVLNGSGKTGLAAQKQQILSGQGFSNVSVDNYAGNSPRVSTVFYPKEEDRPTAAAIARSLGISESQIEMAPSATGGDQVVVVLKGDISDS